MLADGIPLMLAGDEVGNSQNGNNNAYCQDNPIGWVDWAGLAQPDDNMTDLVGRLADLRRRFPQLRPRHWTEGRREDGSFGALWLTPQAAEMTEDDWNFPEGRFLAYALGPVEDSPATLFVVLNAAPEAIEFTLPRLPGCDTLDDSVGDRAAAEDRSGVAGRQHSRSRSANDPGVRGRRMKAART